MSDESVDIDKDEEMRRFGGNPKCYSCGKTVYLTERVTIDGNVRSFRRDGGFVFPCGLPLGFRCSVARGYLVQPIYTTFCSPLSPCSFCFSRLVVVFLFVLLTAIPVTSPSLSAGVSSRWLLQVRPLWRASAEYWWLRKVPGQVLLQEELR